MTTPERLRRRQRRESAALAVLAILLAAVALYFHQEDEAQRDCVNTYIAQNAATGKVRSNLVERESRATRGVISAALTAKTREEFADARADYFDSLKQIDALRRANPVQPFPEGVCE